MNKLTLDHDAGASLLEFQGHTFSLTQPELVNLDVIHAPALETLHLGNAEHVRHLAVRGAPQLHTITAAPNATPLVMHLHRDGFPPMMRINSPVQHIDIDWQQASSQGGQAQTYLRAEQHWQHVTVLSSNSAQLQKTLQAATEKDLILLEFVASEHSNEIDDLELRSKAHLVIFNLTTVKRLQVHDVASLIIDHSDHALTTLNTTCAQLTLRHCPNLGLIESTAHECDLEVSDNRADALSVHANCRRLSVKNAAATTLAFSRCQRLHIHDCKRLNDIQGDFPADIQLTGVVANGMLRYAQQQFTESLLKFNLENITGADDPALHALLERLPAQRDSRGISQALLILERAFTMGVPIEEVWALRCQLSKNHLGAEGRWHWKLSGDGKSEAWYADFRLWAKAMDAGLEGANRLTRQIAKSVVLNQEGLQCLLFTLQQNPNGLSPELWTKLWRLMNSAKYQHVRHSLHSPVPKNKEMMLRLLKTAIKRFQAVEDNNALRFEVIRFAVNQCNIKELENMAAELFSFDRTGARTALMRRAQEISDSEQFFTFGPTEELAGDYMRLALGQVTNVKNAS